jgi:hypothetical protein
LQNEASFSWFARLSRSTSGNGLYSYRGGLFDPADDC